MDVADLDDVVLQRAQDRLLEFIQPVPFKVVEQRDAQLFLVRALDKPEVRTEDGLLVGLQIIEEVTLN